MLPLDTHRVLIGNALNINEFITISENDFAWGRFYDNIQDNFKIRSISK